MPVCFRTSQTLPKACTCGNPARLNKVEKCKNNRRTFQFADLCRSQNNLSLCRILVLVIRHGNFQALPWIQQNWPLQKRCFWRSSLQHCRLFGSQTLRLLPPRLVGHLPCSFASWFTLHVSVAAVGAVGAQQPTEVHLFQLDVGFLPLNRIAVLDSLKNSWEPWELLHSCSSFRPSKTYSMSSIESWNIRTPSEMNEKWTQWSTATAQVGLLLPIATELFGKLANLFRTHKNWRCFGGTALRNLHTHTQTLVEYP